MGALADGGRRQTGGASSTQGRAQLSVSLLRETRHQNNRSSQTHFSTLEPNRQRPSNWDPTSNTLKKLITHTHRGSNDQRDRNSQKRRLLRLQKNRNIYA